MQASMILKICEIISIVLSALVGGMYWGPWLALSRSMGTFVPEVYLAIVKRMSQNMATLMTVLVPVALLSIIPVLFLSYHEQQQTFYLTLTGFVFFVVALLVTVIVEVPIVQQVETWTVATLPDNWQQLRDRWVSFHIIRVGAGVIGLIFLVVGAI